MGMYTEFVFGAKLKENTPEEVIEILKGICYGRSDYSDITLPNHEFFKCSRWKWIASSSSCYFGAPSTSVITKDKNYDEYRISIRANLKDYDNEIDKFVEWIKPYVDQGSGNSDFLGFQMYEENSYPKLYFLKETEE